MATKFTVNIESNSITVEAFGSKIKAEDSIELEHGDWKLTISSHCAYYEYFEYQMIIEILEEGKILFSCKKIADDEEEYDFDDNDFDDNYNNSEDENNYKSEYEKLEITKTLKISENDYCVCFKKKSENKLCLCPR